MKLYVYCLAAGLDALAGSPSGISGAPVRLLTVADLTVVVSDSETDAVPVTRENALAHAAVVRSVFELTTPLPFRFGTLVAEPQLRNYIAARKAALETKLAHVRDCVEMSVKIIWDEADIEQSDEEPVVAGKGVGASFLAEKRREILGNEARAARAAEISTWLREIIRGLARDEQLAVRLSEKLVLAAGHLVERANIPQYREKLAKARNERPELHFLVSGPWPPYSFANIELEFKTQFGVS
jgi:hypothetical protein